MTEEQARVPKLRFPGFADAWEQRKLGELVDVRSGQDYKHLSVGDIPVYGTGGYMLSVDRALSYSEDAIGIGRKGTIDKPYVLHAPFWTVDTLFYAVPKEGNDLDFLYSTFERVNWRGRDESTGVPSLSKKTINSVYVTVSNDPAEQRRIGAFFVSLDDLIALHQRKLSHLGLLKRGLLQKMFPKLGEACPEIRFPGFADAWEQRKLGEIVSWSKGSNLAKAVLNENKSGEEVIHYADLYKFAPVVHDVIHWSNSGEGTIIPDNSILFPMSDVTPVGLARTTTITKTAVKAGSDTIIGTVEDKQSAEFISYQVNAHSPKILPLVTGTTVRHISAGALATLDVLLPSKDEQKKIADVFNGLSDLIALHQRKLTHLQQQKKALLQQMFV
jgi:type I restriction enzyme S subunit